MKRSKRYKMRRLRCTINISNASGLDRTHQLCDLLEFSMNRKRKKNVSISRRHNGISVNTSTVFSIECSSSFRLRSAFTVRISNARQIRSLSSSFRFFVPSLLIHRAEKIVRCSDVNTSKISSRHGGMEISFVSLPSSEFYPLLRFTFIFFIFLSNKGKYRLLCSEQHLICLQLSHAVSGN